MPAGKSVRALLLLAVFLSAGTSLPGLDAVLHHSGSAELQSHSHVELAGGCVDHAGHCSLGRSASGSNAVAGSAAPIHSEPLLQPPQVLASFRPWVGTDYPTTARPRAPPSPIA